jgi:hypothetical protein
MESGISILGIGEYEQIEIIMILVSIFEKKIRVVLLV